MNYVNALRASLAATALSVGTLAQAALPVGAEEAIAQYKTDVLAAMGLMIAAGIAIFAVRRLGQKLGWF